MREIRLFGSEGGVALTTPSLPLSKAHGQSSPRISRIGTDNGRVCIRVYPCNPWLIAWSKAHRKIVVEMHDSDWIVA